jgi:hypothetical protein
MDLLPNRMDEGEREMREVIKICNVLVELPIRG